MRYVANPVIVEAHVIEEVIWPVDMFGHVLKEPWFSCGVRLDNGEMLKASSAMISRYLPQAGDYWVIQEDGYAYINPKAVFERKYSKAS